MTHRKLPVTCPDCWGSKTNTTGSGPCPTCNGTGKVEREVEER